MHYKRDAESENWSVTACGKEHMGKRTREYVYGINPAFEVVRAGRRKIYGAYLSESSARNPRMKKLEAFLERREIGVEWVEKGRIRDLSGSKDNQGVVLRCSPYPYADFADVREAGRIMLLDNVEDPHNVGAILRSAEIFGFNHVLLPMKGVPDVYPSIVKVSAGATEFMQIVKEANANTYVKRLVDEGYQVIALDGTGTVSSQEIYPLLGDRVLLVIGGEDKGVGQYILNTADYVMKIPQSGRINSLNASVAAGIAMYALGG
jgi:23S rRNA (guanosine2251-2'-O)-methyltransferase